mgnify:FL=1
MAKLLAPLFSAIARGTFANTIVYQKRRFGSSAYPSTQSNHGNSNKQQYNRSTMAEVRSSWKKLTTSQRNAWNDAATAKGLLSGYHMFVSWYLAQCHAPFDIPANLSLNEE